MLCFFRAGSKKHSLNVFFHVLCFIAYQKRSGLCVDSSFSECYPLSLIRVNVAGCQYRSIGTAVTLARYCDTFMAVFQYRYSGTGLVS